MMYKVKMVPETKSSKATIKKNEAVLKDLLTVMPVLKKHKLDGEIHTKIRKLRNGRKSRSYSLEVSRNYRGEELKASSSLASMNDKIAILRDLKNQIRAQIQAKRKEQRPPVEDYTFSQGVTVKKLAEVYLEPNAFFAVFEKKLRLDMVRGKKPKTEDPYIGVEIELASKKDREFICDQLHAAGMARYVCVKDDGSIGSGTELRRTYPHTHEITVCVRQSEYQSVIETICKVLNDHCEVAVDKTCGLHVHIDMRKRDVKKAFHNLVSMQQFLYAMLPVARRNSQYSYPIKGTMWRTDLPRYHGINTQAYSKYGTIEARMHCGTTQAKKINNWIALLISMVDAPQVDAAPTTVEQLQAATGIAPELVEYVKARVAKFAPQHTGAKYTAEQPNTMPEIAPVVAALADDTLLEQSEVA